MDCKKYIILIKNKDKDIFEDNTSRIEHFEVLSDGRIKIKFVNMYKRYHYARSRIIILKNLKPSIAQIRSFTSKNNFEMTLIVFMILAHMFGCILTRVVTLKFSEREM